MEDNPNARKSSTLLTLKCGVCSEPAPDHYHFGGKHLMYKN